MNAQDIRSGNELEIYTKLLKHPDVKRVNEMIARREAEGTSGLRRRLLSTSVRLSQSMAPDIHKMADECIEKLSMELPLELYVFASPQFNAMCFKPEEGRLFVMFSSSLLEAFNETELRFVMGHELGHHVYGHHDIPIGYILRGEQRPDPRLALELFTWSRYAEFSADRAGAHCTKDLVSVAQALFKLSSGLTGKTIRFDLDEFLRQIDDMQAEDAQPGNNAPKEDWFSTHPFSPLRVKALKLFDQSELSRTSGTSKTDLEIAVQGLMSFMEPSYLEGQSETAIHMKRLLYTGAIMVADASDGISDEEIKVFEEFFGKREFSDHLDIQKLKDSLDERIKNVVNTATMTQRMQIINDLSLVSKASGDVTASEKQVMQKIAVALEVPLAFVCQTLDQNCEPD
jgi:tellurite resistance protein